MDDSLSIALHKQARSRGWAIAKKSGSISKVTGGEWIVRNLTVIGTNVSVPNKRVQRMIGGYWSWKNEN